jgi:hypothetical protein
MAQITAEQLELLLNENRQLRERLEEVLADKGKNKAAEASAEGSAI